MPIPIGDQNKLRGNMHVTRPVVNYFPAEIVAQGTVSSTVVNYPIGSFGVTWTNSNWQNIKIGQLFVVRSGSNIVTYGVARLTATSNTLFIDGKSRGDSGMAVNQAFGLTAGQSVTVYTFQPLWALLSRIKDGRFYKKFDIPYDGSGSNPSPVCNIGSWRQVWADEITGLGTLSFDTSNSFGWNNKTISSVLWQLPASATNVSHPLTNPSLTFNLPQGFHIVRCTITDSGGAIQTSFRPVWVNGDNFPPLSEKFGFEIGSDQQDRKGRNVSLNVFGDFYDTTFLPGAAMHISEIAYFDGSTLSSGILTDNYVGFSNDSSETYDYVKGEKATQFNLNSPYTWLGIIPMVSQAIVEVASPADWTDIAPGLGTSNFIAWYLLKHHSSFLDMFDYFPLTESNPPRKLNWGLNGSTLGEYLEQCSSVFGGNIGCVSDGSLYLRRDPNIETNNFRNQVDERMTLKIDPDTDVSDIVSAPEIPMNFFNSTGQIRLFALMYDGSQTTAVASIAPGYTQMQAAGSSDEDSFIVKPTQDSLFLAGQNAVNVYAGHLLAKQNTAIKEVSLALNRNMDVFDPAKMLWFRLQLPAVWSPRRNVTFNSRVLPVSIDRAWEKSDGAAWIKNVSVTVAPETFGQPGETYNIDTGAGTQYDPVIPPTLEEEEELNSSLGFLIAIDDDGYIARSFNGENWEAINGVVTGKFQDIAFDYYSNYITSGYSEGTLGAWAAVATESIESSGIYDAIEVWYTTDLISANVPTWTRQYFSGVNSDITNSVRIISSKTVQDYLAVAVHDTNGTTVLRSTNGTTWNSVSAGTTIGGAAGAINEPVDITFDGNRVITSGYDTITGKWKLAYANSLSSNFNFITNSELSDVPWPAIEVNGSNVYATKIATGLNPETTEYKFYVEDVSGVPTVRKRKRVFSGMGFTDSFDPSEMEMLIDGTPIEDPRLITAWSPGTPAQDWIYPTAAVPGTSTQLRGWLLKDAGYTSQKVKATVTFNLNGRGELSTASYNGDTLSKSTAPTSWGVVDAMGRYISNGIEVNGTSGLMYSDADLFNRIEANSFFDEVNYNYSGIAIPEVTQVKLIFDYVSAGGTGNYPPAMIYDATVTFSEVETIIPTLYRVSGYTGGSPTFTNISPASGACPVNPYSMSGDEIATNTVRAAIRYPGFRKYLGVSTNSGTTWTVASNSGFYQGLKQISNFGLLWGYQFISFSEDNFVSADSLYGNWLQAINGDSEYIKVVKAAL